jgi:FkbM family methyltransferase
MGTPSGVSSLDFEKTLWTLDPGLPKMESNPPLDDDPPLHGPSKVRSGRVFVFYCEAKGMSFIKRVGYYLYSILEMMVYFKNWPLLWPIFLRKSATKPREVRLRKPSVRIEVRGRMDVWSVKETFLDEFYVRNEIRIKDGWTIIDVGAGIGDFSIYAAYGKPNTVVYALEPFLESYQLLIKNLTLNALKNVVPIQRALWKKTGALTLDLSGGEPLQIISQEVEKKADLADKEVVQAFALQDFLRERRIPQVDLIKMDCEGAEYEILMHAPRQALAKIDRLVMEYHDLGKSRNHHILMPFLEMEGFRVKRKVNAAHSEIGYLYASRVSSF